MVIIKKLAPSELERIGEVDRREHVTLKYVQQDGELTTEAVDWNVPRWATDGSAFSTQVRIAKWKPIVEQGGAMFGALMDDNLCGFAVVNLVSFEDLPELTALFVSRDWRKQGVGRKLTYAACEFARQSGADMLFASSNNSEAAVRFYLAEGFELAELVHPKLHETLHSIDPEGIHMVKSLLSAK